MTGAEGGDGPRPGEERPALRLLADRLGIEPGYVDQTGRVLRVTSDGTRVLLLRAMGHEAATEDEAREALARLDRAAAEELLPPVRVIPRRELEGATVRLRLPPAAAGGRVAWMLTLESEDGATATSSGVAEAAAGAGCIETQLPAAPPTGYHTLGAAVHWEGGERSCVQRLVVVPEHCWLPPEAGEGEWRRFGLTANLYTVRGERDWGMGSLTDLRALMEWGAGLGADFVGVNPLHALFDRGTEISPYSPVSRLYREPLYLDLLAVPELEHSRAARAMLRAAPFVEALAALRASPRVEYERLAALRRPVLEELHATFAALHRDRDTERGRAYAEFLEGEGEPLVDHATFMAIDEVQTARLGRPSWFRDWPQGLRWSGDVDVEAFREAHAERVDLHCWLQFELDRQLGEAALAARAAGMRLGLYQDLAIGTSGGGSDAWAYPRLLLEGVSLGAPPDLLGPEGQDWGLPPLDPRGLAADGYSYWIQLLRGAFRHAGALRIDHVLGLFRQFWIPRGRSAREGAYVRFPSEDMLGILALESQRHRALVVGEDLGTVPPEVPPALARWHVLRSTVLLFERDEQGAFRPGAEYPPRALATANTHDLAPLAGYLSGSDLRLRARVSGTGDPELAAQLEERGRTVRQLRDRLVAERFLPSDHSVADGAGIVGAVHGFLSSTPSMLVGVALDDLAGETRPVNLPGVDASRFSSWTRRMRRTLAELRADPALERLLAARAGPAGREPAGGEPAGGEPIGRDRVGRDPPGHQR